MTNISKEKEKNNYIKRGFNDYWLTVIYTTLICGYRNNYQLSIIKKAKKMIGCFERGINVARTWGGRENTGNGEAACL